MPMMIVCDKLTYIPGQLITGHVVIISKSPQKVKGLTMRFIGRSSKLMGEVEGTKRYKKEVYFDEKTDIFGHDGSNTQLRVGETLYPFTFALPPGLPASFEWPNGNVLYFVEAKLTRASWKDKRVSTRIQVEGVYDLNLEPSVLTPIEVKRQKYVKHLLTKSGPYGFTFKCSRSGFVRGHSLPFSVEIRNLSKTDSRKLRVSLLQEVKLEGVKSVATLVEQMKGPPVTAGEVVTWEARLKIPIGIPPSNLGNVLSYPVVINVYYCLHIQLSLKNCREEPICIKIPITIGTISYNRRALSVPALDDGSYLPYASNGHRVDCPMSQLILPSAAISTSQFSPHLVSVNTATSVTHTHVTRGHSLLPRTLTSRSSPAPVQILGPVRQYEYYFEYEDASGSTRSVTSRGDSLFQRRRTQSNAGNGRRRYVITNSVTESPPPSYHEIFTREHGTEAPGNNTVDPNVNSQIHQRNSNIHISPSTGREAILKPALSSQLSSSSSEEEDEESQSLLLPPPSANDARSGSGSCSSSDRSSSVNSDSDSEDDDDDDDDDACSTVSATEEFLSCSGSSSSFEEFKYHELLNARQNGFQDAPTREDDTEPSSCDKRQTRSFQQPLRRNNNDRPCPCGKDCLNVQGFCNANSMYRQQHLWALSNSDDDGCIRIANNSSSSAIAESHYGDS